MSVEVRRLVVADVSVLLAAFLPDEEDSIDLEQMLRAGASLLAPSIMPTEFANTLLIAARRGRITDQSMAEIVEFIGDLPIQIDSTTPERSLGAVLWLANATGLTVYDACYLELALRLGAELATIDRQLRLAAESRGVRCLPA